MIDIWRCARWSIEYINITKPFTYIHRSIDLSFRPSVHPFIDPSDHSSFRPSVHSFIHLSVHWLICLTINPCVYLIIFFRCLRWFFGFLSVKARKATTRSAETQFFLWLNGRWRHIGRLQLLRVVQLNVWVELLQGTRRVETSLCPCSADWVREYRRSEGLVKQITTLRICVRWPATES